MKRLTLAASMTLAVVVPGTAAAQLGHAEITAYGRAYAHAADKFGVHAAGCKLIGPHSTCHSEATDARIRRSTDVLHRMFAPPPRPAPTPAVSYSSGYASSTATAPSYSSGGGYSDVPGVPSSFAACVAMRESTNGAGSSNIYGIQGPGGQGSLDAQKQAFAQMYADRGSQPWAAYDGC